MTALFSTPDMPEPIVPPPPPAIEDAALAGQKRADALRKRKGRQATILTSPEGVNNKAQSAPTLLGG